MKTHEEGLPGPYKKTEEQRCTYVSSDFSNNRYRIISETRSTSANRATNSILLAPLVSTEKLRDISSNTKMETSKPLGLDRIPNIELKAAMETRLNLFLHLFSSEKATISPDPEEQGKIVKSSGLLTALSVGYGRQGF